MREKELNIQVHSTHPGIVNTDLFEHSSNTYIPWFKTIFYKVKFIFELENKNNSWISNSFQKPEAGSRTIVYAAISPYLEGKGGTYLSNCYFDKSHKKTKDSSETKKLFDFSCELLKIQKFGEV